MESKPCRGSVIFSAFGEDYYTFIVAPSRVVIYQVSTKAIVFNQEVLKKRERTPTRRFTSLINFRNRFYAGLSDGTIFSFIKDKKDKSKYKLIWSRHEKLSAYNKFECDASGRAITLLGCNAEVLVYQTESHEIVILRQSNQSNNFPFEASIRKLKIDDQFKILVFATQNQESIFIHRIDYENLEMTCEEITGLEDFKLVDISENGDIACHNEGEFIIYNPISEATPGTFCMGDSLNNWPKFTCFAGRDEGYFACCGYKQPEISLATMRWCNKNFRPEWIMDTYADHDMILGWKVSKKHKLEWMDENDYPTIRDVQSNGKNLVVRVQGRPHEIQNQPMKECLLIFELSEKKVGEQLLCTDYIPLDFRA